MLFNMPRQTTPSATWRRQHLPVSAPCRGVRSVSPGGWSCRVVSARVLARGGRLAGVGSRAGSRLHFEWHSRFSRACRSWRGGEDGRHGCTAARSLPLQRQGSDTATGKRPASDRHSYRQDFRQGRHIGWSQGLPLVCLSRPAVAWAAWCSVLACSQAASGMCSGMVARMNGKR